MSKKVDALATVEYIPGKVLTDTNAYLITRINSSRLKMFRLILRSPTAATPYVTMTGGVVAWSFQIPSSVRLHQIGFIHTTAVPTTRSADNIDWIAGVYHLSGATVAPNYIDNYSGVAGSRYVELGTTYIYPSPTMYFSANSTAGDLLWPWIDLEVISESI